ncbi:MarR family winged helix-turn-helix transcriptional regulator [Ferrovibrio sp.]|uniref:MarR family winged helix-turn-helix transcriptional regulator n=1 Tax=Ferrovibrio sp. TaxID=1917215 RepID=UPI00260DAE48|nr:MarR family transcriptional regulator [Ferrovibrio sp.]
MLAENAIGEAWRICYLANLFVFPLYAQFEKEYDVLRPEFVVLFCLSHHQPLIAQNIVDMSGLPKNTLSRGVNRLLARGLIRRSDDAGDRRKGLLSLTTKGRELFDMLMPQMIERRARLLSGLDTAEIQQIGRLLLKMAEAATKSLAST